MQNEIEPTESIEDILREVQAFLYGIACVPGIDTREFALEAFRRLDTALEVLDKEGAAC